MRDGTSVHHVRIKDLQNTINDEFIASNRSLIRFTDLDQRIGFECLVRSVDELGFSLSRSMAVYLEAIEVPSIL